MPSGRAQSVTARVRIRFGPIRSDRSVLALLPKRLLEERMQHARYTLDGASLAFPLSLGPFPLR